jgi:hypothetical protein
MHGMNYDHHLNDHHRLHTSEIQSTHRLLCMELSWIEKQLMKSASNWPEHEGQEVVFWIQKSFFRHQNTGFSSDAKYHSFQSTDFCSFIFITGSKIHETDQVSSLKKSGVRDTQDLILPY